MVDSIVLSNAKKDPTYAPYCCACRTMARMEKVEAFLWTCRSCGAVHDEREADANQVKEADGYIRDLHTTDAWRLWDHKRRMLVSSFLRVGRNVYLERLEGPKGEGGVPDVEERTITDYWQKLVETVRQLDTEKANDILGMVHVLRNAEYIRGRCNPWPASVRAEISRMQPSTQREDSNG